MLVGFPLKVIKPRWVRGQAMRFLFRMMFWLTVIVCLLGVVAGLLAPDREGQPKRMQPTHYAVPAR